VCGHTGHPAALAVGLRAGYLMDNSKKRAFAVLVGLSAIRT
jgi:hypothetical protein